MTNPSARSIRPPRRSLRARLAGNGRVVLVVVVVLLLALLLSARTLSNFWVDKLWYDSVGHSEVFWTTFWSKLLLGLAFVVGFTLLALVSTALADRFAPIDPGVGLEAEFVRRYRDVVGRWHTWLRTAVCVLFGVIIGWPMSGQWQEWLLFRNGASFGVDDKSFGRDAGFYVFKLPFMSSVVDWSFAAFLLILLITAAMHYLNGGIRLVPGQRHVTPQVKLHLSLILAAMALLKAADYWLSRYELTRSARGFVDGMSYTEATAQLPALNLLILISLFAAVLLIVNVWQRGIRLPVISVGLWLIVAIVAGTLYPAAIQFFQVRPNPSSREAKYIDYNIEATRYALGLDKVAVKQITADDVTADDVEADQASLGNARLLDPDPKIMGVAFNAETSIATTAGYGFGDVDVDRYIDAQGKERQVVIGVRTLVDADIPTQTWEGRHLQYTHGYGLAVADAAQTDDSGSGEFTNVAAPENPLDLKQPQVYFADTLGGYAVVDTSSAELGLGGDTREYEGKDGVKLTSTLRQIAFAVSFGEYNLFGSSALDENSRVIYRRNIRDRLAALAPYLALDGDPYPAIVDGRITWIVDAYTTTSRFPNAETADSRQVARGSGLNSSFNYVRNSVKATVDAYDGTVTMYVVDKQDPIIRAWQAAFPDLYTDGDSMSASLRSHVRYPEDLFRVQTNMFGRYRLDTSAAFYSRQQAWSIADDPPLTQERTTASANPTQTPATVAQGAIDGRADDSTRLRFEPYYNMFRGPGETDFEFRLVRPYSPFTLDGKRGELVSLMTASSDPDTYGTLTVYEIAGPKPRGPLQVSDFERQANSALLTQIDNQGAEVRFGAMQIVPVGKGFVFVRPWFATSTSSSNKPQLTKVAVTSGTETAVGDTLQEAIGRLFPRATVDLGGDGPTGEPTDPSPTPDNSSIEELLTQADALFTEAEAALTAGDLGVYQSKLEEAYRTARKAAELAGSQTGDA